MTRRTGSVPRKRQFDPLPSLPTAWERPVTLRKLPQAESDARSCRRPTDL